MRKTIVLVCFNFCVSALLFSQEKIDSNKLKKAQVYLEKLQIAYGDGDYKIHKLYSDSLLHVAKKNNFHRMRVLALTNQAVFYNNRNEREKSIDLYHKANEICELIPEDYRIKAVVLVNMGNTYNNIGAYKKSIKAMEIVIKIADDFEKSDKIKAAALNGLANNFVALKEFNKALKYLYQTKHLGEKINNQSIIASSVNNILDAHINLKNYQKVLDISDSISDIAPLKQPTKTKGWFLFNVGIANYHLKQLDVSLDYLNQCKTLAQEKNLPEMEMSAYEFLAKIYEQKENFKASYNAQKKYSLLKESFLDDKKSATSIDFEKNISSKEKEIVNLSEKRNQLLISSIFLLLALSVILFIYIKRKKTIEREQVLLRKQYLKLQESIKNTTLKKSNHLSEETNNLKPYKNSSLTQSDRERFKQQILTYMDKEKPYLDADLKQIDLASKMNMSTHNFSEVLHYAFGQNFYNFINSYRILAAEELIKNVKYENAKIIAIAFDSGFKSKTSFNRVFKKHTGFTPSEYRLAKL